MKKTMPLLLFFISICISSLSLAEITVSRCSLRGQRITEIANHITKINSEKMPEAYLNQIELEAEFTNEGQKFSGVIEGFYRPKNTVKFSIIPTAIAAVELDKNSHLIYVCAEVDENSSYRLEIYFLGQSNLKNNLNNFSEFMTNVEKNDDIQVVPLQLSILSLGLDGKPNKFKNLLKILILPYYLQKKIFSGFANIFSEISGINIERVILTEKRIQVAGGIDLTDPDHPRFSKTILLDSEEGKMLTTYPVDIDKN